MNWLISEVKSWMWLRGKSACWNLLISSDWCPPSRDFLVISEKKKEKMILDQFELKNMALRFENSAWTTGCFDMYSFFLEHCRFKFRPYLLPICMFIFFRWTFPFCLWLEWCFIFFWSFAQLSLVFSQRPNTKADSTMKQLNSFTCV